MATARGEVRFELREWAAAHDLTFVDEAPIMGVAFMPRRLSLSNVCFGVLPGGEHGAAGHEFRANSNNAPTRWRTRVAVRVPEAVAPLRRFAITNTPEMQRNELGPTDQRLDPGLVGLAQMTMTCANPVDVNVLTALLSGVTRTLLDSYPGPFELSYEFGTLTLTRNRDYLDGADLDSHCQTLCAIAQAMRAECLTAAHPLPFETELAAPAWLDEAPPEGPEVRRVAGVTMVTPSGPIATQFTAGFDMPLPEPWRSTVVALAGGAPLEDPLAYHAAFPQNPVPGHAFAVMRQAQDGSTARIAMHTEGQLGTGACAVLMPVNGSAGDHSAPITTEPEVLSVAVKDGLMAAWMHRGEGFGAEHVALVAREATNVATQQGWLPR